MSSKIYVGNLSFDARERDLDDAFYRYGKIRDIYVARGYGFVDFQDPQDAEDAIKDMHDQDFMGRRLKVQLATAKGQGNRFQNDRRRGGDNRGQNNGPKHRVVISNLPERTSWQDLKDFMRKAGDVTYTKVERGIGFADFVDESDMEYALTKMDGEDFRGNKIRIELDDQRRGGGGGFQRRRRGSPPRRSRSRSRSGGRGRKGRSRSHSGSRGRRYSRERSGSRERRYSRERSGSRGRRDSRERSGSRGRDVRDRSGSRGRDVRDRSGSRDRNSRDRSGSRDRNFDRNERNRDNRSNSPGREF